MTGEIRLHLGCGSTYKPGFVNVDMLDGKLADVLGDARRLPFKTKSVDRIETFHLLEHFDYVSCRYVLSEWYRLLRNGGALVLETPDLLTTLKKFGRSDIDTQYRMLQWIYGVDSPGMAHKTGFSYDLARHLLEECGFRRVEQRDPETHTYEPGMRIECVKPDDGDARADFISAFRLNLCRELGDFDSYVMLPLEKHLRRVLTELPPSGMLNQDSMVKLLSKAAAVSPRVALAAVKTIRTTHTDGIQNLDSVESKLKGLRDGEIHKKAFTLWSQGRRGLPVAAYFEKFMATLESDIAAELRRDAKKGENLSYLLGLDPREIAILDLDLVLLQAKTWLNRGIKEFSRGELHHARSLIEQAARTNPGDPLASWNLARLELADGCGLEKVNARYHETLKLTSDRRFERRISKEAKLAKNGREKEIQYGPVSE